MRYSNSPTYKKLVARFENLTGQRKWAAVEFNPETLADHFKRHGSDLGADAQAYAAAALKFVNGKGDKAVIFAEDGIRRMYSEVENILHRSTRTGQSPHFSTQEPERNIGKAR